MDLTLSIPGLFKFSRSKKVTEVTQAIDVGLKDVDIEINAAIDEVDNEEAIEVESLVHCIYASSSTSEFSQEDIFEMLKKIRVNNAKLNVTGMLLYENGSFFQVLEGDEAVIEALYEKINADGRHVNISKIIQEPIEARSFGDWTMGYAGLNKKEMSEIDGLNDFFLGKSCFLNLDKGRAKKLLGAFKDGKWRAAIK